jgi:biopolymer transport protein ExbB/TolQ
MALTTSIRPTRELPLLLLAGLIVGGLCVPAWQWARQHQNYDLIIPNTEYRLPVERVERLLLGPEQIACYVAFTWASLILLSHKLEVWRQRRAFALELLPTEEGSRILPEDARPHLRRLDQAVGKRGPYMLAHMVRLGLGKFAVSHSAPDVGEVVRSQADVELGRSASNLNLVNYLAWAIPALGFLGTVRGLSLTMSLAGVQEEELSTFLSQATKHLNVAFDCTLVALALSLGLMYLLHTVQRDEETLVIDCQQYCQEHLLLRLYVPQPEPEPVGFGGG